MTDRAPLLSGLAALGSLVLAVLLGGLALELGSQLALAQAADSLLDVTGATLLAWAVRVARQPRDAGHPMGHSRAEALGALAIAALAGLLAFEVGKSAILSLLGSEELVAAPVLLVAFFTKVAFKSGIWAATRRGRGPALRALSVDARNDVLVGAVAIVGFVGVRLGYPALDAWLTIPLALYIGYSGFGLARENIDLLMGAAPALDRQRELLRLVSSVEGVARCGELRAQYLGAMLSVHAKVEVPAQLSVGEGSEIARRVAQCLEAEEDVVHASVVLSAVASSLAPQPGEAAPPVGEESAPQERPSWGKV
jgi:cation diffusion facilitator family transporter